MEKLAAIGFHVLSLDGLLYGVALFLVLLCVKLIVSMSLLYFSYSRVIREPQLAVRLNLRESVPTAPPAAAAAAAKPRGGPAAPVTQASTGYTTPAVMLPPLGNASRGGGVSASMVAAQLQRGGGRQHTPGGRTGARALFSHVLTPSITPVQGDLTPSFAPLAPPVAEPPLLPVSRGGSHSGEEGQDSDREDSIGTVETDMFSLHSTVTDGASGPMVRAISAQSGASQGDAGSPVPDGGLAISRGASGFSEMYSGSDSGHQTPLMYGVGGLGGAQPAEAFTVPARAGSMPGGDEIGASEGGVQPSASLRHRSHGSSTHSSADWAEEQGGTDAYTGVLQRSALHGTQQEHEGLVEEMADGYESTPDSLDDAGEEGGEGGGAAGARMWRTMSDGTLDAVVDGVDRYTLRSGRIPM